MSCGRIIIVGGAYEILAKITVFFIFEGCKTIIYVRLPWYSVVGDVHGTGGVHGADRGVGQRDLHDLEGAAVAEQQPRRMPRLVAGEVKAREREGAAVADAERVRHANVAAGGWAARRRSSPSCCACSLGRCRRGELQYHCQQQCRFRKHHRQGEKKCPTLDRAS